MEITSETVVFLLTLIGAVAAAWWRIENRIEAARRDMQIAVSAAQATAIMAREDASALRVHVAETYASKDGLRQMRDEIVGGVRDLKASLDHLNERMDRVVAAPARPRGERVE